MMRHGAYRPETLAAALACRRDTGALPYAGGTDLMCRGRRWMGVRPRFDAPLLFVGHLNEIRAVHRQGEDVVIGAGCTLARLCEDDTVPGPLRRIAGEMASPAVRNLATIGGNVCNASPAGDTLPFLYAVGARLVLETIAGRREVPVCEFITGPGTTGLGPGELLTRIIVPAAGWDVAVTERVTARRANAPSKVSFLGLARLDGHRVADLRIAFGAVGPTVVRRPGLERDLAIALSAVRSGRGTVADVSALIDAHDGMIRPIDDQRATAAHRRRVALNLLRCFLDELCR